MEELLKDEKSQEILKQFIQQYIKDNLRLNITQYQNMSVDIDVYVGDSFVCSAQS